MKSTVKTLSKDLGVDKLESFEYDVSSVAWLNEADGKSSPRTVLNNYKILVMMKGQSDIYIGKDVYHTKAGDCVLFAPGSLYHAETTPGEVCQFVAINFSLHNPGQDSELRKILGLKDIAIYPQLIREDTMRSFYNMFLFVNEERDGAYYNALLWTKRMIAIICYNGFDIINHTSKKKPTSSEETMVLRCHRYIISNPDKAVTVDDLCSLCNVSQSYLYKCFQSMLGISTKEFITRTKLDISAKQLLQTDKTISQIATENGYSNGYRYSNIFKKVYGTSPSSYRRQNQ